MDESCRSVLVAFRQEVQRQQQQLQVHTKHQSSSLSTGTAPAAASLSEISAFVAARAVVIAAGESVSHETTKLGMMFGEIGSSQQLQRDAVESLVTDTCSPAGNDSSL